MSGFDDYPDLDDPAEGIDNASNSPRPVPGEAPAEDDYETLVAERENRIFTAGDSGRLQGPLLASDIEKNKNISMWHVEGLYQGKLHTIGDVDRDISLDELLAQPAILYALEQGIENFAFSPHHPVRGILRHARKMINLSPKTNWQVREVLENQTEEDDTDDIEISTDQRLMGNVARHEVVEIVHNAFGSMIDGPVDTILGANDKLTDGQMRHVAKITAMGDMYLTALENAMSRQLEAVNIASEVTLNSLHRSSKMLMDEEVHAHRLAFAQRKLELSVPFAERILTMQAAAGKEIDEMTLHRVAFGEEMSIRQMASNFLYRMVTGKQEKTLDLGAATVTPASASNTSTPKQIETPQIAKDPTAAALSLRQLKGSTDRDKLLAALESHGCGPEDLTSIPLPSSEKERISALLAESPDHE